MANKELKIERNRRIRVISGRVDIAASAVSVGTGNGFTLTDGGAGIVTVTITKPGKSIIGINAIPLESTAATGFSVKVLSKTEASDVQFGVYQHDATDSVLVDNVGFYFEIKLKDVNV